MTKKGFAAIYIIILLIPVMLFSFKMIDLTVIDYKIGTNIYIKQQALYNAEAGIEFAYKTLQEYNYPKSFNKTYYINMDENHIEILNRKAEWNSMAVVVISSKTQNSIIEYLIDSTGSYKGFNYNISKTFKHTE